jgi:hypothetical protein
MEAGVDVRPQGHDMTWLVLRVGAMRRKPDSPTLFPLLIVQPKSSYGEEARADRAGIQVKIN